MISVSHGQFQDELMRTLLLAALDAIVVEGVLSVVGRWVERMGLGVWVDGVVRYQGAVASVTVRDITHQGHHANNLTQDEWHKTLLAVATEDPHGAKAQWQTIFGKNKKEKGPSVGSAQQRSPGPARWYRSHSQRRAFDSHAAVLRLASVWLPAAPA